jgi:MATE family multidrug resistance protein
MRPSGCLVTRFAYAELLRLSVPITLAQFSASLLLVTNSLVVTMFAPDHLATLGGGNGIFLFAQFVLVAVLFSQDGFIAQAAGKRSSARLRRVMRTSFSMAVWLGFAAVAAAAALWLGFRGTQREAVGEYVVIMTLSLPLYLVFLVVQKFWNAQGEAGHFAKLGGASLAVNAVAAVALVAPVQGAGLGANGIAWATVVMRLVLLGLGVHYTVRRLGWSHVRSLFGFGHDTAVLVGMAKLGVWAGLNGALDSATLLLLSLAAMHFGPEAMAINQHAMTLGLALFPVYWGISSAATILVGRAIGSGDLPAARRVAQRSLLLAFAAALAVSSILSALVLMNASRLSSQFVLVLLCVAAYQWADSVQTVASGIMRASNIGAPQIVANAVSFYLLGPAYLLVCALLGLGFIGVWVAFALAIVSTGIAHYMLYLRWDRHWIFGRQGAGHAQ